MRRRPLGFIERTEEIAETHGFSSRFAVRGLLLLVLDAGSPFQVTSFGFAVRGLTGTGCPRSWGAFLANGRFTVSMKNVTIEMVIKAFSSPVTVYSC